MGTLLLWQSQSAVTTIMRVVPYISLPSTLWFLLISSLGLTVQANGTKNATEVEGRTGKVLSVFNVISFPNAVCTSTSGYNGTCYTASECTSLGGSSSGTCASSFGVCCVFSLECGATSSQNNTYAIKTSYSTSTDSDPCTYTICKCSSSICKIRIDFDTMVLAAPFSTSSTAVAADSGKTGDCIYDTLSITNPGGSSPPVICGTNTGQHMFVPASDSCNVMDINIDTGTSTTTRQWQMKFTQYECGNQMAPELDCLQYHTADIGTIASYNYDLSATTAVSTSQTHLSSQYYDICFRRQRGYCSICFSPQITGTAATAAGSFGLSASSDGPAQKGAVGTQCSGITASSAIAANAIGDGDYIEIVNLQPSIGTTGTVSNIGRVCGSWFNTADAQTAHITACSWSTPFKVGVHFDEDDSIGATADVASPNLGGFENDVITTPGSGRGFQGFYLAYWMNKC